MTTSSSGTVELELSGPETNREWLIAELGELGFGAFEVGEETLRAFLDASIWSSDSEDSLAKILEITGFRVVSRQEVAAQNWNAQWEAGIVPVTVGAFCVHPPWHEPEHGKIALCIEPKMSFGTAHHETTRLILSVLDSVVSPGDSVMDAGTGTGVLAIAARKLGAQQVLAFDIDPWSLDNARENIERNDVDGIEVQVGGEECITGTHEVVIANINRGALLQMLPALTGAVGNGGTLILSGLLQADESVMRVALQRLGFERVQVFVEGEWIALQAGRA